MNRLKMSHLMEIYGYRGRHAKARAAWLMCFAALAPSAVVAAQATHVVRLEVDTERDVHRFVPARVTARAGDLLVFRVSSGAPHAVAFETAGLSRAARGLLQSAMADRSADLQGPVLASDGMEYRVTVPRLPAGVYRFYSTPHRAYEMHGELIVK
ncbi:MAG: plastocyanin/azurin family copper-binding protein [Gemmatimonadales bacterium]